MRKEVAFVFLVCILLAVSISLVSAGLFDWFKVTGNPISGESSNYVACLDNSSGWMPNPSTYPEFSFYNSHDTQ